MKITQKPILHASWIDRNALEIVKILQRKGFVSYLVGGCVRDLLCGIHPKDYDIATSASPNEVKRAVPYSYIIGKRFRLVLVKRGQTQFEVATFRRTGTAEEYAEQAAEETPLIGDNFFGTPEEDALRRDFTINGLFYDPINDKLIDYSSGLIDIENRILRMIGDPVVRIKEDPIRSLRALRLAHKLNFRLDSELRGAIFSCADEMKKSIMPRRREEYIKIMRLDNPLFAWIELWDLGLLQILIPSMKTIFESNDALEIFSYYMNRMLDLDFDTTNPVELFAPFIMGVKKALEEIGVSSAKTAEFLENLMKNEIGLFKAEQSEIIASIESRGVLKQTDSFVRRGPRRQKALLQSSVLPLALRLSILDYQLTPAEISFWHKQM